MIQFNLFPGGKMRAVTFSYDDGKPNDERLCALMRKYHLKGTFHINSHWHMDKSDEELAQIAKWYEGMEIACHTVWHGVPTETPAASMMTEVMRDRELLEKMAGYPVQGMSYPYGVWDESTIKVLESCGILYSRTVDNSKRFSMPKDYLKWAPTCHHKDALELCDKFFEQMDTWKKDRGQMLFYIWGHSYEIDDEEKWQYMERLFERISGDDRLWYATNMEIYLYEKALRQLQFSLDEKHFYNPTAFDLWFTRNYQPICVKAGEHLTVD